MLASTRSSPEVAERIRDIIADNVAGQLTMGRNWLDGEPDYPRLGDVAVPVLVAAGDRDHPGLARIARLLTARIPGARLGILPGADHLLPMRPLRPSPGFSPASSTAFGGDPPVSYCLRCSRHHAARQAWQADPTCGGGGSPLPRHRRKA